MSAHELSQPPDQPTLDGLDPHLPADLILVSVSRDGQRLHLVDHAGNEYTVDLTKRVSGEHDMSEPPITPAATADPLTDPLVQPPSPSTAGNSTPIAIRPRDIQARIRAGESAEDVAAAAGTTLDKIMTYAAPVLAEREHIADRALKASVRRGDGTGVHRNLSEAINATLAGFDLDPDHVSWDSWRRADGRWGLSAVFTTPEVSGTAQFVFDTAGNFVTTVTDEARWLVGDLVARAEPVRDELRSVRERRQASEYDDQLTIESAATPEAEVHSPPRHSAQLAEGEPAAADPEMTGPITSTPRRNVAKKRGRASVPSWDEIMFGSND